MHIQIRTYINTYKLTYTHAHNVILFKFAPTLKRLVSSPNVVSGRRLVCVFVQKLRKVRLAIAKETPREVRLKAPSF